MLTVLPLIRAINVMRISVMMALDANAQSQLASKHSLQDYSKASSSPEPQDESGDNIRHRRGYQACQRCRERKVKCDLGSKSYPRCIVSIFFDIITLGVDAPHPPPCARCRRERLDCQFAATRKKRKSEVDDRESTPNKRRLAVDTIQDTPPISTRPGSAQSYNANAYPQHSWLSSQSVASASPVPRPEASAVASRSTHGDVGRRHNISGHDVQLHSQVAVETLGAAVASTQDSIKLLVDAANALPDEPNLAAQGSPHSDRSRIRTKSGAMASGPSMLEEALTPEEQVERNHALRAWSRMRFVRAGWFTASEAMQYVDYFYERLAPMSPVVTPDFKSHSRHLALLSEEPVLALAILSIASRHLRLAGHASLSRSYQIHEKLWTYLRCMVERLLWGQEQFGGGFTGGGAAKIRESEGGQITWKGSLRTLGTIEALLLLTDWQPRALHFPPGDDENYLLEGSFDSGSGYMNAKGVATEDDFESVPYASWLEPAWRSDKMSWMLLGLAQALSFELGVFDINHVNCQNHHQGMNECARKRRLRRLVLVYVAQTSGRIGIPTMLKLADWEDEPMFDYTRKFLHPTEAEHPVDIMQSCWLGIAKIMNKANNEIFLSRQYTKELTSSGRYKQSIGEFAPRLTEWKQRFEQLSPRIPKLMQTILRMEFQYARLYINSLGLQNVVESWVERGSNMQRETLVKIADTNKTFIDEVTDAALSILLLVVDGLGPGGHLRNAPVRVYLRSLSGMMFTLKVRSIPNNQSSEY